MMEILGWGLIFWCNWVFFGETFLEWSLGEPYLQWKARRSFGKAILAATFWPLIYARSRE